MDKPELSDFDLTENDIKKYQAQVSRYNEEYAKKLPSHRSHNIFGASLCGSMAIMFFILFCYFSYLNPYKVRCFQQFQWFFPGK